MLVSEGTGDIWNESKGNGGVIRGQPLFSHRGEFRVCEFPQREIGSVSQRLKKPSGTLASDQTHLRKMTRLQPDTLAAAFSSSCFKKKQPTLVSVSFHQPEVPWRSRQGSLPVQPPATLGPSPPFCTLWCPDSCRDQRSR